MSMMDVKSNVCFYKVADICWLFVMCVKVDEAKRALKPINWLLNINCTYDQNLLIG